jgi:hypothetical protein
MIFNINGIEVQNPEPQLGHMYELSAAAVANHTNLDFSQKKY